MSVEHELGLSAGLLSPVLVEAQRRWPAWHAAEPALAGPGGLDGLVGWLRAARPEDADRVLHALVRLGSPTGGDDRAAVIVVAWALLPGARVLAHRLRSLSPRVDELVAAQLWVEVRTFPWQLRGKVAANVLAGTRRQLLLTDLAASHHRASAAGWELLDPHSPRWGRAAPIREADGLDAATQAEAVLADAVGVGVLTSPDVELLGMLLAQAHRVGGGAQRGCGGLLADKVVQPTVVVTGLSAATVRRQVRRSLAAVSAAHRAGLIGAA